MDEFLDACHLCGHAMASNAPICPKCFARSDPEARDSIRQLRKASAEDALLRRIRSEQEDRLVLTRARRNLLLIVVLAVALAIVVFSVKG